MAQTIGKRHGLIHEPRGIAGASVPRAQPGALLPPQAQFWDWDRQRLYRQQPQRMVDQHPVPRLDIDRERDYT